MEKLNPETDGATPDIVHENIDRLREIFPDAFTESSDENGLRWKVDFEALQEILGEYKEDQSERYSFNWNGKAKARRIAQTSSTGTLRPCPEESVNWDSTENLFLEGDNLEVLKLMQKSYHKKVKMIYIDPPYNTGKDFIYPDNFRDNIKNYMELTGQTDEEGRKLSANAETSGRYHTDWLNMMYPRLKLARNLLKDDGVIFISIDDNEAANLLKICDEIFGEENHIGILAVQLNPRGRHLDSFVAKTHESIVIYGRDYSNPSTMCGVKKEGRMIDEYNRKDERGNYRLLGLRNRNQSFNPDTRPNLYFPIYIDPSTQKTSLEKSHHYCDVVWPDTPDGIKTCWTWGKQKVVSESDLLTAEKAGSEWRIYRKDYLIDEAGNTALTLVKSLWNSKEISNDYGRKSIKELFKKAVMDFPKSPELLKKIILSGCISGEIVLDFFSGSCTTAHAIFDLNKSDKKDYKFIMVQLPELTNEKSEAYKAGYSTIAEIGKERIRRVIKKVEEERSEKKNNSDENLFDSSEETSGLDLGFKVFKLDSSNIKPWDADFDSLQSALLDTVENIKLDRSEADVLYELLLKYGLDLTVPIEERTIADRAVYVIGGGALIVCLSEDITLDVVEGIASLNDEFQTDFVRVVFKDSGFADDVVKTNAMQILVQAGIEDVKSL